VTRTQPAAVYRFLYRVRFGGLTAAEYEQMADEIIESLWEEETRHV